MKAKFSQIVRFQCPCEQGDIISCMGIVPARQSRGPHPASYIRYSLEHLQQTSMVLVDLYIQRVIKIAVSQQ
jgi:hypothetical protein